MAYKLLTTSHRPLTLQAWVRFFLDKVAMGQVFLRVLRFSLDCTTTPMLHNTLLSFTNAIRSEQLTASYNTKSLHKGLINQHQSGKALLRTASRATWQETRHHLIMVSRRGEFGNCCLSRWHSTLPVWRQQDPQRRRHTSTALHGGAYQTTVAIRIIVIYSNNNDLLL
jgi:hypothetical protein